MQRLVNIPDNVKDIMTKDVYDKARLYALDKSNYNLVQNLYSQCFNTVSNDTLKVYITYYSFFFFLIVILRLKTFTDTFIILCILLLLGMEHSVNKIFWFKSRK